MVIGGLSQRIYHGGARVRTPPIIPATLERVGSGTPWSFVVRRSRAGARMFGISDQLWFEKSVVFSGTPTPHLISFHRSCLVIYEVNTKPDNSPNLEWRRR